MRTSAVSLLRFLRSFCRINSVCQGRGVSYVSRHSRATRERSRSFNCVSKALKTAICRSPTTSRFAASDISRLRRRTEGKKRQRISAIHISPLKGILDGTGPMR
ncbi:hypothetical protein PUN28_015463 [Cardiocondyla obscurior]|uniref:Secreted protein n=1 Tax=Cardiocondyla obscurior TaxID=286306 RepID=A0AAW2EYH2_9HYME